MASVALYALITLGALASSMAAPEAKLDGVWRSRGYGTILQIEKRSAFVYDINSFVCLRQGGAAKMVDDLARNPQLSADGQQLTTTSPEAFTTIYYDRLDRVPELCRAPPGARAKDPLFNFDAFFSWFQDYYAFAAQRAVDFSSIRAAYRPQVTATTSDGELFEVFKAVLRQLQDHHVSLSSEAFHYNSGATPLFDEWFADYFRQVDKKVPLDAFVKAKAKDLLRASWKRYLDRGSLQEISANIVTGKARAGRIGYLLVLAESGYSGGIDLAKEQAAAAREFAQAFASLKGVESLVLDMRVNFGGDDGIALALAGLFTNEDRPGLAKCTFVGTHFTPIQHTTIRHTQHAFTGPVIVLASPYNVSAGENFMMMIKDFPNVLVVGDRTAGVHSDTLNKELPNGWKISVSNEAFVAPDGTMYETSGVPPDVLVPYYAQTVTEAGIDPLMEKALQILTSADVKRLIVGAKRVTRGNPSPCK